MTYNLKVNEICSIPLNNTNTNIHVPNKTSKGERGAERDSNIFLFPSFLSSLFISLILNPWA